MRVRRAEEPGTPLKTWSGDAPNDNPDGPTAVHWSEAFDDERPPGIGDKSMRAPRLLVALAAAALLAPLGATTASAAPTNDTFAGATVISTLPTTVAQNTSTATTDAVDVALNEQCGAP